MHCNRENTKAVATFNIGSRSGDRWESQPLQSVNLRCGGTLDFLHCDSFAITSSTLKLAIEIWILIMEGA